MAKKQPKSPIRKYSEFLELVRAEVQNSQVYNCFICNILITEPFQSDPINSKKLRDRVDKDIRLVGNGTLQTYLKIYGPAPYHPVKSRLWYLERMINWHKARGN